MSEHYAICEICSGNCGINIFLEGDKITVVDGHQDHPVNQGYLCPKGLAIPEWPTAPDWFEQPFRTAQEFGITNGQQVIIASPRE